MSCIMSSKVKRTYGSRTTRPPPAIPSSPPSDLSSSPAAAARTRKRPLAEQPSFTNLSPPPKRTKLSEPTTKRRLKDAPKKQGTLTQLHFCIDTSILRTCPHCALSYTKGAPDDEALHRAHCARVQRGLEWGREEEKEKLKAEVTEVAAGIRLKNGTKGRIICFRADAPGKIGSKLAILLDTINISLSSPPLTPDILQASKAYLFLLQPAASSPREKIVGCVVAQRISTAMAIASPDVCPCPSQSGSETSKSISPPSPSHPSPSTFAPSLVAVDTSTGLFCDPTPLPTPLGIPRMFVSLSHRRQGVASKLLSAAASTFIHGCPLDPRKGEVAFTQPTGDGKAVMQRWADGSARIYQE
ncbi:hypothetical protein HGRIS_013539 [Hohenbuehelia grisea]|uniref:N-acetyltransferase ECO1 n=1 Tax=Hohenbuehelia grisea TaxID=104357 RepID=A0ABR3IVT4_9AGAR